VHSFGLLHTAYKQTFQAVAQWCCKTESWTLFFVYETPKKLCEVTRTLENLFVLFIFCKSINNFYVGGDGWVLMMADFAEAACSLLLAVMAT
jgi:hypothetical protein